MRLKTFYLSSLKYRAAYISLMYGFCKKSLWKNEPLTSWTLFFWSGKKRGKKCSTGQRFISIEVLLTKSIFSCHFVIDSDHLSRWVNQFYRKIGLKTHHWGLDFNSNRAKRPTWHPKPFRPQSCHSRCYWYCCIVYTLIEFHELFLIQSCLFACSKCKFKITLNFSKLSNVTSLIARNLITADAITGLLNSNLCCTKQWLENVVSFYHFLLLFSFNIRNENIILHIKKIDKNMFWHC